MTYSMIELIDNQKLHSFNVNQKKLQYYVAPEYLKGEDREADLFRDGAFFNYYIGVSTCYINGMESLKAEREENALLYYNSFFKNYITPSKCQIEELEKKYQYNNIEVAIEDLKYLSGNAFDNKDIKIQSILDNIKSIKEAQMNCVVETLNNKVVNKDATVLYDLFLAAPQTSNALYNDIASYFDRFIIDPIIKYGTQDVMLPYNTIEKTILNKHQQYFDRVNFPKIKEKFCSEDYSEVLNQMLPVLIVSGNTIENQQQLKEVLVNYITNPGYSLFVRLTLLASIANLITCKFSLDNLPCLELGIHLMPQPYYYKSSSEKYFGKQEGHVSCTQNSVPHEIYIPLNKMDTIAHEFSHFLDNMMCNDGLPWQKGDDYAEKVLRKIANEVNFEGSLTEYVAYGVTNSVNSIDSFQKSSLVDCSKNYQEIADWRVEYIFKKSDGVLINPINKICPSDSKIWKTLTNMFDANDNDYKSWILTNSKQCFSSVFEKQYLKEKLFAEQKSESCTLLDDDYKSWELTGGKQCFSNIFEKQYLNEGKNGSCTFFACINTKVIDVILPSMTDKDCKDIVSYSEEDQHDLPFVIQNIITVQKECNKEHIYDNEENKVISQTVESVIYNKCLEYGIHIDLFSE